MITPRQVDTLSPTSAERGPGKRGRVNWLAWARWAWIVAALLLAANFVASIPAYYMQLRTACVLPVAQCVSWQPSPGNMLALARLHIPVEIYAAYFISVDVTASLLFWLVGILIFWRKSREWLGLSVSLVLIINGSSGISDTLQGAFLSAGVPFSDVPLILSLPILLLNLIQWPALGIFLLIFPTGRFTPRWSWLIVLIWTVQLGFFWLSDIVPVLENWITLVVLITFGITLGIQIYRYRRVYNTVQRQQVKWFIYIVFTGFILEFVGAGILGTFLAPLNAPDSWYQLLDGAFTTCFFITIPIGIGIAIFRYRLWDIDIIINRTLVYGSLTTLLALLYFGLVFTLQYLVQELAGQGPQPAIIVVSTLVVAALFQPLRLRLQALIDRRFYRSKYDATRTLAAFGSTLHSEVDLDALSERLVTVVEKTMRPAHVSLWLLRPLQPLKVEEE